MPLSGQSKSISVRDDCVPSYIGTIGTPVRYDRDGKDPVTGIVEKTEKRPANWRDRTGKATATHSVRFRIKPHKGRAIWTEWFPERD